MEQEQVISTVADRTPFVTEDRTTIERSSSSDLFIFRPLVAAPTPTPRPSSRIAGRSPAPLRLRFAHAPDRAERLKPQDLLLERDAASFRRLLTQYRAFPMSGADSAECVHFSLEAINAIYGLAAKCDRGVLTYADLHELETALLRVMPEAVLRREAQARRARYRAAVPPAVFRQHMRSRLTSEDDAAGPVEALRAEMATLLSQTQHYWTGMPPRGEARASWQVSACWALGLCVMGAFGFTLTYLFAIPPRIAPAVPLLTALLGGAAAASAYIRRERP